jgi:hypothetical protein
MQSQDRPATEPRAVVVLDHELASSLVCHLNEMGRICIALPDQVASDSSLATWREALSGLFGVLITQGAPQGVIDRLPRASVCLVAAQRTAPPLDLAIVVDDLLKCDILRNSELRM